MNIFPDESDRKFFMELKRQMRDDNPGLPMEIAPGMRKTKSRSMSRSRSSSSSRPKSRSSSSSRPKSRSKSRSSTRSRSRPRSRSRSRPRSRSRSRSRVMSRPMSTPGPSPMMIVPPYRSNMRSGPEFDNFGRREIDNEGDMIPEENRLTRTVAKKVDRKREMGKIFEVPGRMG